MKLNLIRWQSLKTRVTLLTLGIFLISIWSLAFYAGGMLRRDIQNLLGEQQFSTATLVAKEVDHELRDRQEVLERVAAMVSPALLANPTALQTTLEGRPIFQDLFNGGTFITGPDGVVLASVPLEAQRFGSSFLDHDYIADTLNTGKATFGRPVIGKKLKVPVLGMAAPIRDTQGEIIGTVAGVTNLSKHNFLDLMVATSYGKTGGYVLVAPKYRQIITATDKSRSMELLPAPGINPLLDLHFRGHTKTVLGVNLKGVEVLTSVGHIPLTGWYVAISLPTSEAFAPIRAMELRLLLATVLLTLLAAALTWSMLKRQLAPMLVASKALADASSEASEAWRPLSIAKQDEVGVLIGGFNRLLENFQKQGLQLRQSEVKYRRIVENSPDIVYAFSMTKGGIYYSPTVLTVLGYSVEHLIANPFLWVKSIHPEDRPVVAKAVESFKKGTPFRIEYRIKDSQGTWHWLFDRSINFHEEDGDVVIEGLAMDITERKKSESELIESEGRFREIFDAVDEPIFIHDAQTGAIVDVNRRMCEMYGYSYEEALACGPDDLSTNTPPYSVAEAIEKIQLAITQGPQTFDWIARKRDGHPFWTAVSLRLARIGAHDRILAVVRDITERKQAELALRDSEARLSGVLDVTQIHQWTFDGSAYTYVNKQWFDFTGQDRKVGLTLELWTSTVHPDDLPKATEVWLKNWEAKTEHDNYFRLRRHDGVYRDFYCHALPVFDEQGVFRHFQGFNLDITERKQAESQIQTLAFSDPLTGLPNRRLLLDRLKQALAVSVRKQRQGALVFVDLDDFKSLNETRGHDQGDVFLQEVARRLSTCIRQGDTLARLGGDEFVVLLEDLSKNPLEAATQAEGVSEKILAALSQPCQFGEYQHHGTSSIGIALFGDQQEGGVEPLKRAELAMYQAKAAGRNTMRFFDSKMQSVVSDRVAMVASLREAISQNQFLLHYQAQVTGERKLIGVEALVRWVDPRRGVVAPSEFIPLAEETGLILPLGIWVLETACKQLALWATRPEMAHLSIAVNVSARQFHQNDFVTQVMDTLERTGARADRLKLELTESLLVTNIEAVIDKMNALKGTGVGFSIDDFGIGYSSLSYLKRLPLDQLKIDQGFVRDILIDPNDAAIAKMVIVLADSLGLQVIAEGVETEAQRDFLAGLGCHSYQGYLFSRPLPIDDFEALGIVNK